MEGADSRALLHGCRKKGKTVCSSTNTFLVTLRTPVLLETAARRTPRPCACCCRRSARGGRGQGGQDGRGLP